MEDQRPYEIINGETYEMSTQSYNIFHSRIIGNICKIFKDCLDGIDRRAETFFKVDVYLSEEDNFITTSL